MKKTKPWAMVIVGIFMFLTGGISFVLAASDYPTHYIDIIVPYNPGGSTDFAPRLFKDKVEKILGQPLVFGYKPGASGAVGSIYVKGCKPDGYTLLSTSGTAMLLSPLTSKRSVEYTMNDFTPICNLTTVPLIFCVNKESPYKTMKEFVKAAKTKKMKYSTTGALTQGHIAMEAVARAAGFKAIHIPYSGGAAKVMTAVLGGHVDISVSGAIGMEKNLRVLAVGQDTRWENYPDVPTLKELGYPIEGQLYYSIWAPKGTPKEIVDKLYGAFKKALEENREEIVRVAKGANQILYLKGPEETLKIYQDQSEFLKGSLQKLRETK